MLYSGRHCGCGIKTPAKSCRAAGCRVPQAPAPRKAALPICSIGTSGFSYFCYLLCLTSVVVWNAQGTTTTAITTCLGGVHGHSVPLAWLESRAIGCVRRDAKQPESALSQSSSIENENLVPLCSCSKQTANFPDGKESGVLGKGEVTQLL